ncbi:MAG: glutathione S-transferase [Betaproteobacteria bacterium HGW-Betaproteobacteria-8]|nr:MAG: glutathione S-transferase [Betaproteobacteria bacterium HGW-Betaproteobacteria-8]
MTEPMLYSYRRCPYAMRARMALRYAGIDVEIREIVLRDKPRHMLAVSPKGTVPVLVLPDGKVIDESMDIMAWALSRNDPDGWLTEDSRFHELIAENDGSFKRALDQYKYATRFPERSAEAYRQQGEQFLARLEALLAEHAYLLSDKLTQADVAIFPFIRQFSMVDADWFATATYPRLRQWLAGLLASNLFNDVMQKQTAWQQSDN